MSETEKPTISQTLKAGIALMPSLGKAKPMPVAIAPASEAAALADWAAGGPSAADKIIAAKATKAAKAAPVATVATKPVQVAGPHTAISLPTELAVKLAKPVIGQGGWQTMLTTLQGYMSLDGVDWTLTLPDSYVTGKLVPLTVKYGGGGYQSMVRHIVCLWLAAKEGI